MGGTKEEPEDWRFHFDFFAEVWPALLKWEANGFRRIPRPGEDDDLPEHWRDDLLTARQILQFQRDSLTDV